MRTRSWLVRRVLVRRSANTDVDIAEDEPAAPTTEEAIQQFVANNSILEETTIEGLKITFEGEVVGRLSIREAPADGYCVAWAEWCYPSPMTPDLSIT